jgi:hypothetical protein
VAGQGQRRVQAAGPEVVVADLLEGRGVGGGGRGDTEAGRQREEGQQGA